MEPETQPFALAKSEPGIWIRIRILIRILHKMDAKVQNQKLDENFTWNDVVSFNREARFCKRKIINTFTAWVRFRIWIRNRNFSKVGTGTAINRYGSKISYLNSNEMTHPTHFVMPLVLLASVSGSIWRFFQRLSLRLSVMCLDLCVVSSPTCMLVFMPLCWSLLPVFLVVCRVRCFGNTTFGSFSRTELKIQIRRL